MTYGLLDTVVLDRDLPEHGLRRGDLGAIVEVYDAGGLKVEFVRASGETQTVVTLTGRDVRPVLDDDLIAVRSVQQEKGAPGTEANAPLRRQSGKPWPDLDRRAREVFGDRVIVPPPSGQVRGDRGSR